MDLTRYGQARVGTLDLPAIIGHISSPGSRLRGDYVGTIDRWLTKYAQSQLFIAFYDEIAMDPRSVLLRIFRFLGVSATESDVPLSLHSRVNAGEVGPIPRAVLRHAANLYVDELRVLASRYQSFPKTWLERCESALRSN
jgi:hypothetical protein